MSYDAGSALHCPCGQRGDRFQRIAGGRGDGVLRSLLCSGDGHRDDRPWIHPRPSFLIGLMQFLGGCINQYVYHIYIYIDR